MIKQFNIFLPMISTTFEAEWKPKVLLIFICYLTFCKGLQKPLPPSDKSVWNLMKHLSSMRNMFSLEAVRYFVSRRKFMLKNVNGRYNTCSGVFLFRLKLTSICSFSEFRTETLTAWFSRYRGHFDDVPTRNATVRSITQRVLTMRLLFQQ